MGMWNVYFIVKLYLDFTHKLNLHALPNLAFALALAIPHPMRWVRRLRMAIAVPAGLLLFYYDSLLPPWHRLLSLMPDLSSFDVQYWTELMHRLVDVPLFVAFAGLVAAVWLADRWLRMSSFVVTALVIAPLVSYLSMHPLTGLAFSVIGSKPESGAKQSPVVWNGSGDPSQHYADFVRDQATKHVNFTAPTKPGPPFDIILIHICSLATDDMNVAHVLNHPLMSRFDYYFSHFSSAASYSGPAAIRVLRASCGQLPHKDLYNRVDDNCYLFHDLAKLGFTPHMLFNHNGQFDNFLQFVTENMDTPGIKLDPVKGPRIAMSEFDGSPVKSDGDVLSKWLALRNTWSDKQVALYYNTVTLHDGNQYPGPRQISMQTYPKRLNQLLDDVDHVISQIEASGRKAVVVFVPEHGAALRPTSMQIAGMREIPTPGITTIPVGVRLVGFGNAPRHTEIIKQPSSFLSLAQLLANFIANNPFASSPPNLAAYDQGLPQTLLISENDKVVVMQTGKTTYLMRTSDGTWMQGDDSQ